MFSGFGFLQFHLLTRLCTAVGFLNLFIVYFLSILALQSPSLCLKTPVPYEVE